MLRAPFLSPKVDNVTSNTIDLLCVSLLLYSHFHVTHGKSSQTRNVLRTSDPCKEVNLARIDTRLPLPGGGWKRARARLGRRRRQRGFRVFRRGVAWQRRQGRVARSGSVHGGALKRKRVGPPFGLLNLALKTLFSMECLMDGVKMAGSIDVVKTLESRT